MSQNGAKRGPTHIKPRRPDLIFAGCRDPQMGLTKASWGGLGTSLGLLGPVLDQPGAPKKPKEPPQTAPRHPKGSPKLPDWTIFCPKCDNKNGQKPLVLYRFRAAGPLKRRLRSCWCGTDASGKRFGASFGYRKAPWASLTN